MARVPGGTPAQRQTRLIMKVVSHRVSRHIALFVRTRLVRSHFGSSTIEASFRPRVVASGTFWCDVALRASVSSMIPEPLAVELKLATTQLLSLNGREKNSNPDTSRAQCRRLFSKLCGAGRAPVGPT